jgi:hypothetical protein
MSSFVVVRNISLSSILCLVGLLNLTVSPVAGALDASLLVDITMRQYAAQKEVYSEGEGETVEGEGEGEGETEGEDEPWDSIFLPWQQYAAIGGIVGAALGIVWLADEAPSPCMVATAAYGTPLAPQINLLRRFRDRVLLSSAAGTAFVDVYYRVGGIAAQFIVRHDWAARAVRTVLVPVLLMVALALLFPGIAQGVLYGVLVTAVLIMLYWMQRLWGLRKADVAGLRQ